MKKTLSAADTVEMAPGHDAPTQNRPPARLRIVNGAGRTSDPRDTRLAEVARHYLRERRRREARLPAQMFADPVWDTLLDLFASQVEGRSVSISDACIAATVPPTTALRWFAKMEECDLVIRQTDLNDARRAYIELTPKAADEVRLWLHRTFVEGVQRA